MSCNMLSYVEHYQPSYFLLENVAGFLEHHIVSRSTTSSGNVVTIKFGMVKFVARALIALGSEFFIQFVHPSSDFLPFFPDIKSDIDCCKPGNMVSPKVGVALFSGVPKEV